MDNLISRQKAIDALNSINCFGWVEDSWKNVCDIIERVPPVQPERKKGKWVWYDGDWLKTMYKCSECGAMIDINEKWRNFFCYHCGADMRGEEDE